MTSTQHNARHNRHQSRQTRTRRQQQIRFTRQDAGCYIYDEKRNWLVLIKAVTSHSPVIPKRLRELKNLFGAATPGLVFVTVFPDRKTIMSCLGETAWETEVWTADAPSHLIHFNGERFWVLNPE